MAASPCAITGAHRAFIAPRCGFAAKRLTLRAGIERRLEALETRKSETDRTPKFTLTLDKSDGTKEIHIFGPGGGVFIMPAKISVEQWKEAESNRAGAARKKPEKPTSARLLESI